MSLNKKKQGPSTASKTEKKPSQDSTSSLTTTISSTSNSSLHNTNQLSKETLTKWQKQTDSILSRIDTKSAFIDPFFNIEDIDNNLVNELDTKNSKIEWIRPKDLFKSPILGIESKDYTNVLQGSLDDCSLISSFCSIIKYPYLIKHVFSSEINLADKVYKGLIQVNLFIDNQWEVICIDDRLPVVGKKLCYSKCKTEANFWVPLLEKVFAKVYGSYKSLIALDSALCMVNLTGGFVLRLNPTHQNEQETILNYLGECKNNNFFIGIAGCELVNRDDGVLNSKNKNVELLETKKRIGHAFSLVDSIIFSAKNKAFLKMHNCNPSLKLGRKYSESDKKLLETFLKTILVEDAQTTYFSFEEFFEFFEVLNLLVIPKDKLPDEQDLSFFGLWEEKHNLMVTKELSLIEKYLNSPHFLFEIKNNNNSSTEHIVLIMNIIVQNFVDKDFLGYFILPVCKRENLEGPGHHFYFVNYTIQNQSLSNCNPFTKEIKLLPGMYLFGLVVQSTEIAISKEKKFIFRIATSLNTTINQHIFKQINVNDNNYLVVEKNDLKIKLVLAKCCVCEFILDGSFLSSGPKTFCLKCYNATYRCYKCNCEVGKEYYTIEQRIFCDKCIEEFT